MDLGFIDEKAGANMHRIAAFHEPRGYLWRSLLDDKALQRIAKAECHAI